MNEYTNLAVQTDFTVYFSVNSDTKLHDVAELYTQYTVVILEFLSTNCDLIGRQLCRPTVISQSEQWRI